MLVQMVYERDVNQLSSGSELALTLVIQNLLLHNRVTLKHYPPGYIKYRFCCLLGDLYQQNKPTPFPQQRLE